MITSCMSSCGGEATASVGSWYKCVSGEGSIVCWLLVCQTESIDFCVAVCSVNVQFRLRWVGTQLHGALVLS